MQRFSAKKRLLPLWFIAIGLLYCISVAEAAVPPAGYPILSRSRGEYYIGPSLFVTFSQEVETRVAPIYAISLTPQGTVASPAYTLVGSAGDTLYCMFLLKNLGNARDSLAVGYQRIPPSTGDIDNLILFNDADGDTRFDPGEEDPAYLALQMGDSVDMSAAVVLPTDSTGSDCYLSVYALSTGDSMPVPEVSVIRVRNLDAISALLSLGPTGNPKALTGGEGSQDDMTELFLRGSEQTVTFRNDLLNEAPAPDLVEIGLSDSTVVPNGITVSYVDSTGQAYVLTSSPGVGVVLGFIGAGELRTIDVRILSTAGPLRSMVTTPLSIELEARSLLDTLRVNRTLDRLMPPQAINPAAVIALEQTFKENVGSIGDVVTLVVTVRNISDSLRVDDVVVSETYQPALNFLRSNGFQRQGKTLVWRVGTLGSGEERKTAIKFLVNSRVSRGWTKVFGETSGLAETGDPVFAGPVINVLRIENDLFASEGVILGEVFIDENANFNRDDGETGVHGAAVYLESGVFAITDSMGKFSLPETFSGYRVLRLDEASLPPDVTFPGPIAGNEPSGKDRPWKRVNCGAERIIHLLRSGHAVVQFPLRRQPVPEPEEATVKRRIVCQEKISIQKRNRVLLKTVSVPSSYFPSGKAYLRSGVMENLLPMRDFLLSRPGWWLLIEGHTDSIPVQDKKNFKSNLELSTERANAVRRYFVANGVAPHRLIVRGYGETRPIASNSTAEGRNQNRRVDLSFIPPGVSIDDEAALKRVKTKLESLSAVSDSFRVTILWELSTDSPIPRKASFRIRMPDCFADGNVGVRVGDSAVVSIKGIYPVDQFVRGSGVRCEATFFADVSDTSRVQDIMAVLTFLGETVRWPGYTTQARRELKSKGLQRDSLVVRPLLGGTSTKRTVIFDLLSWDEPVIEEGAYDISSRGAVSDSISMVMQGAGEKLYGIIEPVDSSAFTRKNEIRVRARVPLGSRFTLYAGGMAVSEKQIGQRDIHISDGFEDVTWFAVEIRDGWNTIHVHSKHVDGTQLEDSVRVVLASRPTVLEPTRARLLIPADGKTQEVLKFALKDGLECPIGTGFVATVAAGDSLFWNEDEQPDKRGLQVTSRDGYFILRLKPCRQTGRRKVILECEGLQASCDVAFIPPRRPFFVSGILEARLGAFAASGSASPLGLSDYYDGARLKGSSRIFLQGTAYGGMNLTARLDTKNRFKDPFQRKIEPDRQYAIYGDASDLHFAAPSQGGNYIALERDESYVRYGDFRTPLGEGEFLRYERAATGLNAALSHKKNFYKAFLTKSDFSTVKDEIRGDGTSGYYYLSRSPVVEHSEKIILETRDRYQLEKVLEAQPLALNRDYTINYFNGAVLFKSPIPVTDGDFNPVFIVVIYETRLGEKARYLYGLRANLAENNRIRIGSTAVVREGEDQRYVLYGVDGNFTLGELDFAGEFARSEDDVSGHGNAFRIEAALRNALMQHSIYVRKVDGDFLNPSFSGGAHELATLKVGFESHLRLNSALSMESDGFRHDLDRTDEIKENLRAQFKLKHADFLLSAGARGARHELRNEQKKGLLALAGMRLGQAENLMFSFDLEKNLQEESVDDYPDRLKSGLGVPFLERYRFLVDHEYRTASGRAGTHQATAGVESKVGASGTAYTRYRMSRTGSNERVGAVTGLKQKMKIRENIFGTFEIENFHSLSDDKEMDYFALKTGLGAVKQGAHLLEGQYEYRWQKERQKHLLRLNTLAELNSGVSLLFKNAFSFIENLQRKDAISYDGRLGCAYRPDVSLVKALCLVKSGYERFTPIDPEAITWKLIFSTDVNLIPVLAHELRLKYAIKRVEDYSHSISITSRSHFALSQYVYNFREFWDLDLWGWVFTQGDGGTLEVGSGIEIGRRVMEFIRVGVGYSVNGFEERDLSENEAWSKGFGLRVQFVLSDWMLREMGF
ncbi:MAG: OmpA family protein [Candidatus Latescibacteria bacterium]|nr:OmpA family protein [Candidatus Latescibacterota bacterium]NIM64530.1 OmpA family protein [Candidatus Latescibacterota bacterium]NIO00683.1 OmpA family protein [Candidatus Latescibacterota bacterium]NIO27086.1 OmpA family protein [Candidatus Latescibacterota bacterium]NIO54610.1 OmpA family protein [Candidatus Latescibacterota bacterium]